MNCFETAAKNLRGDELPPAAKLYSHGAGDWQKAVGDADGKEVGTSEGLLGGRGLNGGGGDLGGGLGGGGDGGGESGGLGPSGGGLGGGSGGSGGNGGGGAQSEDSPLRWKSRLQSVSLLPRTRRVTSK